MSQEIRVRFAPSPTGPLHIGGARSALFNYLLAKKNNGKMLLRIEDTDRERSSSESEENIKDSLKWLGINWDEGVDVGGEYGPYRQMERLDIYKKYIDKLLSEGKAYKCYCTEEELEKQREEQRARGETPRYAGCCRDLTPDQEEKFQAQGRRPVIRFRVPGGEIIRVDDAVRGKVNFESDGIGDFVIVKSDGIPTYNFAVVVDDHEMKITHVIRGEEHLTNTARQVLLYEALELSQPTFAHVSLILGKDRSKMSKRHGHTSVVQYRINGFLPEAIVNFLALLGWSPEGEEEIFTLDELIKQFSLDRVVKSPAVFDMEKLKWINGYYIRNSSIERIVELAIPFLQEAGYLDENVDEEKRQWVSMIVAAVRNRLSTVREIVDYMELFINDEIKPESEKALKELQGEQVSQVLETLLSKLQEAEDLEPENVKKILKSITKELKLGGRKVFMPIRIALTGQMSGPEMHDVIPVLGIEKVEKRISYVKENFLQ
ncbi:MAG: glutamyl-tRNA synthetase [Clostridiales bacterium]|jgi:nondiscriminating glutamyl-tRNA synthetase|nr:glutamyl-tRNA synthetase [Clostridiales bacterium]